MKFVQDDGGRSKARIADKTDDSSTCRAITIASGRKYHDVHKELNAFCEERDSGDSTATGILKSTAHAYLETHGWNWHPTMRIGSGARVHLKDGELPTKGRLVVAVSRRIVAVVDGVIRDSQNPSRNGTRCVYGYWEQSKRK